MGKSTINGHVQVRKLLNYQRVKAVKDSLEKHMAAPVQVITIHRLLRQGMLSILLLVVKLLTPETICFVN